mgnify:CR=1 FL=1
MSIIISRNTKKEICFKNCSVFKGCNFKSSQFSSLFVSELADVGRCLRFVGLEWDVVEIKGTKDVDIFDVCHMNRYKYHSGIMY